MSAEDCERKMVDCPYCGKAFNLPTVERQLAAAEQREAVLREAFNLLRRVALPPNDVSGRAMWDEALAAIKQPEEANGGE